VTNEKSEKTTEKKANAEQKSNKKMKVIDQEEQVS
jgi:hypothetical protein